MRSQDEFEIVRQLVAAGLPDRLVSELTQIPRCTIRDWRLGRHFNERRAGSRCDHDPDALPPEQYAYLLGTYLGDGSISAHPRGVFRLRISCDTKYPGIIGAIRDAMRAVRGHGPHAFLCGLIDSDGCRITARYRERNGTHRKYGRYVFSNRSEDLHRLFTESLDAIGVHWTRANKYDTAVARQRDVRKLDNYIGPKE